MPKLEPIIGALTALNASKNEIVLYCTSFTYGKQTIGKLARLAKLDRSSAYLAAEQLNARGLLEQEPKGKQKIVWVRSPKEVLARLRIEIRKLREYYDAVSDSLPRLLAEYQESEQRPVLQFFSGVEGLKQITENVLENSQEEILLLTNQQEERNVFSDFDHRHFIKERLARKIKIRVLAADTPEAWELKKKDNQSLRETRIIYESNSPFTTETYIYANRVAMLGFTREFIGFIVHSREFCETQRWMFEQLWEKFR